jgi:hypothetical protein
MSQLSLTSLEASKGLLFPNGASNGVDTELVFYFSKRR